MRISDWSSDVCSSDLPGLLFCQLHRGIGGASVLMNYAVWESLSAFRAAFDNPEFWEAAKNMPEGVVARSLLVERIAVSNICVAYEALETAIPDLQCLVLGKTMSVRVDLGGLRQ